jgi:hypothetical protein
VLSSWLAAPFIGLLSLSAPLLSSFAFGAGRVWFSLCNISTSSSFLLNDRASAAFSKMIKGEKEHNVPVTLAGLFKHMGGDSSLNGHLSPPSNGH